MAAQDNDDYLKAGGSFATLFSGAGSSLSTNHHIWAFVLIGLALAILAATAYLQISRKGAIKVTGGVLSLATLALFCVFGYQELHRPAQKQSTTTTTSGPTVNGSAATEGSNAPAVVGSGNSVSYGAPAPADGSAPKRKQRGPKP